MFKAKTLPFVIASLGLGAAGLTVPAAADDLADIKTQMQQLIEANQRLMQQVTDLHAKVQKMEADNGAKVTELQAQVKKLDADTGNVVKNNKLVTAGDEDGTFKLFGSETSVGIYGYAHLDMYKDLEGRQSGDWAADIGSQPVAGLGGDTRKGKFNMTARQSRLGVKTVTPTEMGMLRTKVEADFVKSPDGSDANLDTNLLLNNYVFRLRHAYGELDGDWGKLLAGQTWSTFMNLDTMPETIDFNGHASSAFIRQPMLRYTANFEDAGSLALAIENPANVIVWNSGTSVQTSPNIDKQPDLIANWSLARDWGMVSAQALFTKYDYNNGLGVKASKSGHGLGLGGVFKPTPQDSLMLQYTTGKGLGRYVPTTSYHIAYYDAANGLKLYDSDSLVLGWTRAWSDTVRTTLSYGGTKMNDNWQALGGAGEFDSREMTEGFANIIWGIAKNTELGLEYSWGERETYPTLSGEVLTGKRSRIGTSLHYAF